jgi:hypothetical protein
MQRASLYPLGYEKQPPTQATMTSETLRIKPPQVQPSLRRLYDLAELALIVFLEIAVVICDVSSTQTCFSICAPLKFCLIRYICGFRLR